MKKLTILYSDRSSKTGKELVDKLSDSFSRVFRKRTNKRFKSDVVLRWGSTEEFSNLTSKLELNSLQAVKNASDKLAMMKILVGANIPTAEILFDPFNSENLDSFRDENGGFFVRGSNGSVRYDDIVTSSDLYVSKSIENKRREYRVHVFNGEVIAIYEKIPQDENVKLFKSHNCKFSLVDMSRMRLRPEDLDVCINAVNSLGLLFGGVDLMRDKDQNVFVSEVNSAPALNGTNINRYLEKIKDYVEAMES